MGVLTQAAIIDAAVQLAGNSSLDTQCQVWLPLLLGDIYENNDLELPNGLESVEGNVGAFALTAGTSPYLIGKSGGFYTGYAVRAVKRIALAEVGVVNSIFEIPVIAASLGDMQNIPSVGYATSTPTGRPRMVRALRGGADSVRLEFSPAPDKAYRVYMLANMIPTLTYAGSSVAAYWNDLTLVKGLYAMCLGHQQDEREEAKLAEYHAAVKRDIARHLTIFGTQAKWNLSRARFGSGGGLYTPGGSGNSTGWMGPR